VGEAVQDYGIHATVDTCLALLDGHEDYSRLPVPLTYLAGAHAVSKLGRGDLALRRQNHWPRAWAARALRYVWLDYAEPGIVAATADPSWRVRETAAKVVGQRHLTSGAEHLQVLVHDRELRVRVAGVRALGAVGGLEHVALVEALETTDTAMRVAVDGALRGLRLAGARRAAV
jgi:HEAT repeat protein